MLPSSCVRLRYDLHVSLAYHINKNYEQQTGSHFKHQNATISFGIVKLVLSVSIDQLRWLSFILEMCFISIKIMLQNSN